MKKEKSRMDHIVAKLEALAAISKNIRRDIISLQNDHVTKRDEMKLDELETKMIDVEMAIKRFTQ